MRTGGGMPANNKTLTEASVLFGLDSGTTLRVVTSQHRKNDSESRATLTF